jgi:hypothetical protein
MNARSAAITLTPLATMIALGAGLRVGASDRETAAIVFGAPLATGSHALAWQIAVSSDDRGIREPVVVPDLEVTASHAGTTARWRGATNADGIAEAHVELPGLTEGGEVHLEVRAARDALAVGPAAWGPAWSEAPRAAWARPARKDGPIALDVAPVGERLPVGFAGVVGVRATDRATGAPLGGVTIDVEPEPGLEVTASRVTTCANGWGAIGARPTFQVTGMSLHAQTGGREGAWFGGVPTAGGASHASVPMRIAPGEARAVPIDAASPRGALYAEIDDPRGRRVAQVLAAPRALLDAPPLAEGLYWIVTSNEARGAEALARGSVAQPFVVARASGDERDACTDLAVLAQGAAPRFPRWIALDGFAGRRERARARHARGTAIGLLALAIGGALEALLVLGSARRSGEDLPAAMVRRSPAGNVAIGVLAALLGFALLAALLVYWG